jgi:SAM-dependent methyltransferase
MDEIQSNPSDLLHVTLRTLGHYEARAAAFRAGTRDHDVRQNIDALLSRITAPPPFTLLDFGCGPGRELKTFRGLGHVAIGLDGAASLAAMARADTGCEVWQQDFLALDLPEARFDGVFANASLFHVPVAALPRVLRQLQATLKPGGVPFSSNPHGHNDVDLWPLRSGVHPRQSA